MHTALFTPMIYRRKKVKSFQEGFIERRERKIFLLDDAKRVIESMFSSADLEEGLEIDFDQNYCLVGEIFNPQLLQAKVNHPATSVIVATERRIGLKRSNNTASAYGCGPLLKMKTTTEPLSSSANLDSPSLKPLAKKSRLSVNDVKMFHKSSSNEDAVPSAASSSMNSANVDVIEDPVSVFMPKTVEELLQFFMTNDEEGSENDKVQTCSLQQALPAPPPPPAPPPAVNNVKKLAAVTPANFRKPLLSKFTMPPTISTNPTIAPYQSQSQQKHSVKGTSAVKPISKPTLYQSLRPNILGLVFFQPGKPSDKWRSPRLFREMVIPEKFTDISHYQKTLEQSVLENMNLDLADLRVRFDKAQKNEQAMRAQYISFYANVSLKPASLNPASLNPYSHSTVTDRPTFQLSFQNKEHHSVYSKDDIWILSDNPFMKNGEFFRSTFYGSSGDSIELTSLSKSPTPCSAWIGAYDTPLYALRCFNANSEMMILDMLGSEYFQETSLVKNMLHRPYPIANQPKNDSISTLVQQDCMEDFEGLFEDSIEQYGLNEDQAKVIRSFVRSLSGRNDCPVVLAHGVYGAGKSFLIAVLIMSLERANSLGLFSQNIQVVFSSMTNVAVDRILLSLKEMEFTDFVRVGSLKKISKSILPYTCKSKASDLKDLADMLRDTADVDEQQSINAAIKTFKSQQNSNLLKETFLVGITCLATNFEVLDAMTCPIVILDECSQMTEPMSLLPIVQFRARFALLVGDPKQLAPTLAHSLDPKLKGVHGLERTLFERLSDASIAAPILLSTQYRCHPQISKLSNHLFYESRLRNGAGVLEKRTPLVPGLGPLAFVRVDGVETKLRGSYRNDAELELVCKIVAGLIDNGVTGAQIGVISLYKSQSQLIEEMLKTKEIVGLQAATVDSFQGSEKDVIIVSTVRSGTSSFLEDTRRINVALTRAKRHLIILACDGMANASKLWRNIQMNCQNADPGILPARAFLALFHH